VLYIGFSGQTDPLIPLFAIGVFVAFTLAQSAMVRYWLRHREQGWRRALATNLLGAILSGLVVLIAAITKFTNGAWIVVIVIPLIVLACRQVHRHYQRARDALRPRPVSGDDGAPAVPPPKTRAPVTDKDARDASDEQHLVVVPIAVLDLAALRALSYAVELSLPVLAVHVSPSEEEGDRFLRYWREWGDHLPLEIISSPYRATLAPLTNYIEALHREHRDVTFTVIVPELVVARAWQRLLHNRIAGRLHRALIRETGIIVTSVPFQLPA
jgi:hypothetical protein